MVVPPIVSDSIFTNSHFSSARLTRALSRSKQMSNYTYNLGVSIERALSGVPKAQPALVAGYWSNRDFWLDEFSHLLFVIDDFDERLAKMEAAYDVHSQRVGGEHNRDEYGNPRQSVRDPTSSKQRREDASGARSALKKLADRALDLDVSTSDEYDAFLKRLRITGRNSSPNAG